MKYKTIKYILFFAAMIIAFSGCNKDEDVIVVLNPMPGSDFLDIENDGYVVRLNAEPAPEGQSGTWRIYIGENGRFDDVNDPESNFYGEPGEKYVLGWELSQRDEYKAATIDVTFKPLNPVILNTPQDTLFNNISLYLKAEEPRFGASGEWEIINGKDGGIVDATSAKAQFIGTPFTDYTIRWSLKYGSKTVSKELSFYTDELNAQAGNDNLDIKTLKDTEKYFTLEGFLPAGAEGNWEVLSGEGGKVYDQGSGNSLFGGIADTLYSLKWTVTIGETISSDTVDLRFRGKWGVWTDPRDGQNYRFAEINGMEWMADNYNYALSPGEGSWYYGQIERGVVHSGHALETEEERKYYGRLYSWHAANYQAPDGWRLPSAEEFSELVNSLGGPLYALGDILEGGETGLELNLAGYIEKSSSADPAYRNVSIQLDNYGLFWFKDYSETYRYASMVEVSPGASQPTLSSLPVDFYALSVRYVRDIAEEN
ncbi:hypothetical protein OU798_06260 [Prolixibacteraceae bacterium Z1-6]|uniref:Fibrobacter succinogenes major paralogous domain-containing protein n=1 Tax=Draconibacterium aestuarii TaxID=2998507 RepID=A0A9X3J513_9BACT|nr:hypothetical protein [Prolixibacteraceae bacterium Z1-6]